jgi:glycosyltransferase involved in cell wall biosynthesis
MSVSEETVSVIIPTYRRRPFLLRVLDDLARQTRPPVEVFVVDSSPPDEQLSLPGPHAICPLVTV